MIGLTITVYIGHLMNILNNVRKYIKNLIYVTVIPCVRKSDLEKIKIKVPKNKQLITDLESKFQEIEQCQENVKTFEQQYEQKLKDLYQAAVKEIK